jgi:hypothetical protein
METRLSAKGLRVVSHTVISVFAVASLLFFVISVDRTTVVELIAAAMLVFSMYRMWLLDQTDLISLLIFFFGTTACFSFFSDVAGDQLIRLISIVGFAVLSLVISNYLLNTVRPQANAEKALYKVSLAIIFTEIFWVLSFINASAVSKGAITAVVFFLFQMVGKDILEKKFDRNVFVFLVVFTIILLAIVIYRI